ncbi:hypothetical protein J5751_05920 [bacterium]|nr:hypothetical protein [bacterium]
MIGNNANAVFSSISSNHHKSISLPWNCANFSATNSSILVNQDSPRLSHQNHANFSATHTSIVFNQFNSRCLQKSPFNNNSSTNSGVNFVISFVFHHSSIIFFAFSNSGSSHSNLSNSSIVFVKSMFHWIVSSDFKFSKSAIFVFVNL